MSTNITNEFKSEFAMLLVIMKINYGTTPALNYSKTLFEWTLGALVTEGKILIKYDKDGDTVFEDVGESRLADALKAAERKYAEALEFIMVNPNAGQKAWAQKNILETCFKVDKIMFPIALSEGILDLKDVTSKVMSGMGGLNIQRGGEDD